jgi:fluoroacetyl-CoA thioesterase
MEIQVGACGTAAAVVTNEMSAKEVGSGSLQVLGTPWMVAIMERAACNCLAPFLEHGKSTVGAMLQITHDKPTPVGMEIRAEAEVTAVEGRKITLSLKAFDEKGQIGSGTHVRVLIEDERFLQKAYAK